MAALRRLLLTAIVLAVQLSSLSGAATAAPIAAGAYVPGASDDPRLIDRYGRAVGRRPVIVMSYKDWSSLPFDAEQLDSIWRRGAVPLITWEPWTSGGKAFPLREIAGKRFDRYLRRSARSARNWGKPLMVRFAHEMNGDWYPWGAGVGGNTERDFRKAWKHIVDLFRFHGATNVIWIWSPNEDSGGTFQLAPFYPGDEWVDWVGMDGFNFGGDEGWPSFTKVFASTYDRLAALTSRPLMIAETGSGEAGGEKAAWIASALGREAPRFPKLRALVWYDERTETGDFRVASSPEALRAFRSAIASSAYDASRDTLLRTPSSIPGFEPAPEPPGDDYGAPSLLEEIRLKLHGAYLAAAIAAALGVLAATTAFLVALRRRWRRRRPQAAAAQ